MSANLSGCWVSQVLNSASFRVSDMHRLSGQGPVATEAGRISRSTRRATSRENVRYLFDFVAWCRRPDMPRCLAECVME